MPQSMKPLKVLIVDDHPIVRGALGQYISSAPDMVVAGSAGTGAEALAALGRETPDVVLLDWLLPDARGHELVPRIKAGRNGIKVLVFSAHEREEIVRCALDAGADGFIHKGEEMETVLRAVRAVAAVQIWAGRDRIGRLVREARARFIEARPDGKPLLTAREREVARLVAEGDDTNGIASRLYVSEGTVKLHISNILRKVNRKNRLQLALWVQQNGLLTD